nr:MAG TPA: hypothetical protein [Caudoviricetes sp.]
MQSGLLRLIIPCFSNSFHNRLCSSCVSVWTAAMNSSRLLHSSICSIISYFSQKHTIYFPLVKKYFYLFPQIGQILHTALPYNRQQRDRFRVMLAPPPPHRTAGPI